MNCKGESLIVVRVSFIPKSSNADYLGVLNSMISQ